MRAAVAAAYGMTWAPEWHDLDQLDPDHPPRYRKPPLRPRSTGTVVHPRPAVPARVRRLTGAAGG